MDAALLLGACPRRHRHGSHAASPAVRQTGLGGLQAAVQTDLHVLQAGGGPVKLLVGQVRVDLLHDLLPHGDGWVAGIADLGVVFIACPHRGHIVGGEAHEIAVKVIAGGAGLAGDGHAAEFRAAAGAAVDRVRQHLVHQIGSGLLHSHVALALVLQDHIALGILHPEIVPRLIVNTVIGKSRVGRRHLHGVQPVGQTAHAQSRQVHIVRHQGQVQLHCGKGKRFRCAHRLHCLYGDGVDGALDALRHRGHAGIGVG